MRDGVTRQTQRPCHPAKAASRVPASIRPCVNPVYSIHTAGSSYTQAKIVIPSTRSLYSRQELPMKHPIDRREFLKLAGLGGVVFASSLGGAHAAGTMAAAKGAAYDDFYFVQLSDTHWGFEGPPNPDAKGTLKKAVAAVNSLSEPPDFIVFTGDLTHTTDDPKLRRQRLAQFREIVSELKVKDVRFMPGEHDASLDHGDAYQEFFGKTHYTFDHKGVHFIALDNVSDPRALIGEEQLQWLAADLKKQPQS